MSSFPATDTGTEAPAKKKFNKKRFFGWLTVINTVLAIIVTVIAVVGFDILTSWLDYESSWLLWLATAALIIVSFIAAFIGVWTTEAAIAMIAGIGFLFYWIFTGKILSEKPAPTLGQNS